MRSVECRSERILSWNQGTAHQAIVFTSWAQLTIAQVASARTLGYDEVSWIAELVQEETEAGHPDGA